MTNPPWDSLQLVSEPTILGPFSTTMFNQNHYSPFHQILHATAVPDIYFHGSSSPYETQGWPSNAYQHSYYHTYDHHHYCHPHHYPSSNPSPYGFEYISAKMGTSLNSKHKRRATDGKKKAWRKKRKYELGRHPTITKLSNYKTIRRIRVGGSKSLEVEHDIQSNNADKMFDNGPGKDLKTSRDDSCSAGHLDGGRNQVFDKCPERQSVFESNMLEFDQSLKRVEEMLQQMISSRQQYPTSSMNSPVGIYQTDIIVESGEVGKAEPITSVIPYDLSAKIQGYGDKEVSMVIGSEAEMRSDEQSWLDGEVLLEIGDKYAKVLEHHGGQVLDRRPPRDKIGLPVASSILGAENLEVHNISLSFSECNEDKMFDAVPHTNEIDVMDNQWEWMYELICKDYEARLVHGELQAHKNGNVGDVPLAIEDVNGVGIMASLVEFQEKTSVLWNVVEGPLVALQNRLTQGVVTKEVGEVLELLLDIFYVVSKVGPAELSNRHVTKAENHHLSYVISFQNAGNGFNLRKTLSMLLERIASELNMSLVVADFGSLDGNDQPVLIVIGCDEEVLRILISQLHQGEIMSFTQNIVDSTNEYSRSKLGIVLKWLVYPKSMKPSLYSTGAILLAGGWVFTGTLAANIFARARKLDRNHGIGDLVAPPLDSRTLWQIILGGQTQRTMGAGAAFISFCTITTVDVFAYSEGKAFIQNDDWFDTGQVNLVGRFSLDPFVCSILIDIYVNNGWWNHKRRLMVMTKKENLATLALVTVLSLMVPLVKMCVNCKTTNSGPSDHIFIFYSEHEGIGVLGMLTDHYANDLIELSNYLYLGGSSKLAFGGFSTNIFLNIGTYAMGDFHLVRSFTRVSKMWKTSAIKAFSLNDDIGVVASLAYGFVKKSNETKLDFDPGGSSFARSACELNNDVTKFVIFLIAAHHLGQVRSYGSKNYWSPLFFSLSSKWKPLLLFQKHSFQNGVFSVQMEDKYLQRKLEAGQFVYKLHFGLNRDATKGLSLALPQKECFAMLGPDCACENTFPGMMNGPWHPNIETQYIVGREQPLFHGILKYIKSSALSQKVTECLKSFIHPIFVDLTIAHREFFCTGTRNKIIIALVIFSLCYDFVKNEFWKCKLKDFHWDMKLKVPQVLNHSLVPQAMEFNHLKWSMVCCSICYQYHPLPSFKLSTLRTRFILRGKECNK